MDSVTRDADLTPECKDGVQEMQIWPQNAKMGCRRCRSGPRMQGWGAGDADLPQHCMDSVAGDAGLAPRMQRWGAGDADLSCGAWTALQEMLIRPQNAKMGCRRCRSELWCMDSVTRDAGLTPECKDGVQEMQT